MRMGNSVFLSLFKKDVKEQIKTSKAIVFVVVFVFFGLLSPISALFMPQIMASVSESQNIKIVLPEPTWLDAVLQYVKNLTQMCTFIVIIIYMGFIAKEKETGTLIFLLVKPVRRSTYLLSKYLSVSLVTLVAMILAFVVSSGYTFLFFEDFDFIAYAKLNLFMFFFVLSVVYLTVFFSSIFKSQIIAGILSFVGFLLFSLLGQLDKISLYLPSGLLSEANKAVTNVEITFLPLIGTFVFLIVCVYGSMLHFRRWEP